MFSNQGDPRWFIVSSGDYEGRWHLAGWMHSAIKGEETGPGDDGWMSYAICPRCFAMVHADEGRAWGDQTWAHEQWHARTDYPIPEQALADVDGR